MEASSALATYRATFESKMQSPPPIQEDPSSQPNSPRLQTLAGCADSLAFFQLDAQPFVQQYCLYELQLFLAIPAGAFCSSKRMQTDPSAKRFVANWEAFQCWMKSIVIADKPLQDKARDLGKMVQIAKVTCFRFTSV